MSDTPAPQTLDELWAQVAAGETPSLQQLPELSKVKEIEGGDIRLGGGITLAQLVELDIVQRELPLLIEATEDMSIAMLNDTLADSIADGGRDKHISCALIALGAFVEFSTKRRKRLLHTVEVVGKRRSYVAKKGEIATALIIPTSSRGSWQYWKSHSRQPVHIAGSLFTRDGKITVPRFAVFCDYPSRLFSLERALRHRPAPDATDKRWQRALGKDLKRTMPGKTAQNVAATELVSEFIGELDELLEQDSRQRPVDRRRRSGFLSRSAPSLSTLIVLFVAGLLVWRLFISSSGRSFRSEARQILSAMTSGNQSRVDDVFEQASPLYREKVVRVDFHSIADYMTQELGEFQRVISVMKSDVQETKEGKTGITKLKLLFSKHEVEGELSFHFFDDRWRLLGLDIQLPPKKLGEPPDFKVCQVPMDLSSAMSKLAERIRKRQYDTIFEEAESALKASKGKEDFATMMQSHEQTFGRFVRQLDVLSCWHNSSGTRYNTVMVYEYAHAQRKAVTMWGLVGNQWKLLSYKVVSKS